MKEGRERDGRGSAHPPLLRALRGLVFTLALDMVLPEALCLRFLRSFFAGTCCMSFEKFLLSMMAAVAPIISFNNLKNRKAPKFWRQNEKRSSLMHINFFFIIPNYFTP